MATLRELFVTIGMEVDDRPLTQLDKQITSMKRNARNLGLALVAMGAGMGLFLKHAGDMEQVEIAFETMLGSAERARELLNGLKNDAKTTPFTLPGILREAKKLLAFGRPVETLREDIEILGNIAAGVGTDKLPFLSLAFGQVATNNRLLGQEVRQFTQAGVPLIQALADSMGKSGAEIQKMQEGGKITFDDVREALLKLTSGSGRFANLMEKQSKSLLGLLSNTFDALLLMADEIGQELLPAAKELVKEFLHFVEINEKIISSKIIKFYKGFAKLLGVLFIVMKKLFKILNDLAGGFGGLGDAILFVVSAWAALIALQAVGAMGSMVMILLQAIKAWRLMGNAALVAQAKMIALPFLVGAAMVALLLILEDIAGFFMGKNSITELILDAFENKLPKAFGFFKAILDPIIETIQAIARAAADITSGNFLSAVKNIGSIFDPTLAAQGGAPQFTSGGSNSTNVNAPITVTVPPGTSPTETAAAVEAGVRGGLADAMREAQQDTGTEVEF